MYLNNCEILFIFETTFTEIQHSQNNKIGEGAKNMAEALAINTLTILNLTVRFVYFLQQPIWKLKGLVEIQHSQNNKSELKVQRTWQKHWKSTTHWQHCIWRWDLFIFETINLEIDDFIEIQHSQGNKIGVEGAKNMAEALAINNNNNTLTTLDLQVRFVYFWTIQSRNWRFYWNSTFIEQ